MEDVEYGVDELTYSEFSKSSPRVFYGIDNGKAGVFPSSNFVHMIETLGWGFYNEELAGHLHKVESNESGSLDRFEFLRCYVDE